MRKMEDHEIICVGDKTLWKGQDPDPKLWRQIAAKHAGKTAKELQQQFPNEEFWTDRPLGPPLSCPVCSKEMPASYWNTVKQLALTKDTPGELRHGDPAKPFCYVTRLMLVKMGLLKDPYAGSLQNDERSPQWLLSTLGVPTPYESLCEIQHEDYV